MPANNWLQSISEGLSLPTAMAIDSENNLYIAESSENRVLLLNPYGEIQQTLWGLNQPISIATGRDGSIYIGSVGNGSVAVYNAALQLQRKLGSGNSEFAKPSDLAVDSANYVYVVDGKKHAVNIYHPDGRLKTSFGSLGKAPGLFTTPVAIALNEAAGEIIVSDLAMIDPSIPSARIQIFDLDGLYKRSFYTLVNGNGYLRPFAITVDQLNRIYVADAFQNSVAVFDSDGLSLGVISDPQHPFRTPMGLSFSAEKNRLFVASLSSAKLDVIAIDSFDPTLDVRSDNGTLLGDNYDFGTVSLGSDSEQIEITVTNSGNSDLEVGSVTITDNSSGEFAIADNTDSCSNQTLKPLSSCTIYITFSPLSEGSKTALLRVPSNATGVPITSTILLGTGRQPVQHNLSVIHGGGGSGRVQGTGIDCGEDCSESFDENSSVTLTAISDAGTLFTGWSVPECGTTTSCQVTLTQDEAITATFSPDTPLSYEITATTSANGSISPSGLLELDTGTSQTYIITPDSNYQVKQLLVDNSPVAIASSYTFNNITANHTIAVEFEATTPLKFTFESGMITKTDRWVPIVFSRDFTSPIVVASVINNNPLVTSHIRIRNLTSTGFELRVNQFKTSHSELEATANVQLAARVGGLVQLSNMIREKRASVQQRSHIAQQGAVASGGSGAINRSVRASYLVVEEGSFQLSDGSVVDAGKVTARLDAPFSRESFTGTFETQPVIQSTVTSFNTDADLTISVNNVAQDGFNLQVTGGQTGQTEELSYVAWEPSAGIVDGIHFEVNLAKIIGDGSNKSLLYLNSHLHRPVILGGIQTTNGTANSKPVWQFETSDGVEIRLASGAQEELGYMIFSLATVLPGYDADGDGIEDIDEVTLTGSSPILADTDGDGLNDGDEKTIWGAQWSVDADGDSVVNLLDFDSDNDSFSDGIEVEAGSDPSNPLSYP